MDHAGDHYTVTNHALRPLPPQGANLPFLIGGNGDKMLTAAAQLGDIVGFTGFTFDGALAHMTHFTTAQLADRVEFVRRAAGDRFEDIELNVLIQRAVISDDREAAAEEFREQWGDDAPPLADMLASPFVLFGTVEEIAEQIRQIRGELGISYWVAAAPRAVGFEAVVAELAGT